jgi:hypothetical protein
VFQQKVIDGAVFTFVAQLLVHGVQPGYGSLDRSSAGPDLPVAG